MILDNLLILMNIMNIMIVVMVVMVVCVVILNYYIDLFILVLVYCQLTYYNHLNL